MNTRLFALFGAALLAGVAVGPAMAAAQSTEAGNAPTEETDAFGHQVSTFVQQLQTTTNGTGIGQAVSSFVVANNPGNAPAHAGGPGAENATDNGTQGGPPAFVQALFGSDDGDSESADDESVQDRRGPPAHAGGPDNEDTGDADANETADEETSGDDRADEQGPADHAGGDDDSEKTDDGEDDEDADNGQGPPAHAGPGDDADENDD
jgi:hypothetical protein